MKKKTLLKWFFQYHGRARFLVPAINARLRKEGYRESIPGVFSKV